MTSLTFSPFLFSIHLHRFPFTTKPQFHPLLLSPRVSTMTTSASIDRGAGDPLNSGGGGREDVLVQYVVLRRDLIEEWPMGSVVTQGCHAAVAAMWMSREDEETREYCGDGNIDHMHKVTLEVKGETQMLNLSEKLKAGGIVHKLWIEQPENIPTCLATKPYPKSSVASFFKKLKLCTARGAYSKLILCPEVITSDINIVTFWDSHDTDLKMRKVSLCSRRAYEIVMKFLIANNTYEQEFPVTTPRYKDMYKITSEVP